MNTVRCTVCTSGWESHRKSDGICPNCRTPENKRHWSSVYQALIRVPRKKATLSMRDWLKTVSDFSGKCAYCLENDATSLDHFVPVSKGGETSARNCVPACATCNYRKQNFSPYSRVNPLPRSAIRRVGRYLKARKVIQKSMWSGTRPRKQAYQVQEKPKKKTR